jgi:hypothetical protein
MAVSKEWNLIRSWLRKTYNKEVHEYFKDLPPEVDPDNSSGRSTTKAVCLIGAKDSQGIAAIKRENFEWLKRRVAQEMPWHPFIALPDASAEGHPQIQLWFYERYQDAKRERRKQTNTQISFRIRNNDWSSLAEAEAMARKIRDAFARPIYHIDRGEEKITYNDKLKGYQFTLYVIGKTEAKRILTDVFQLIGDTPNWDKLTRNESEKDFKASTTVRVVGEPVKTQNKRPITKVYFRYAIAKVPPSMADIPLIDTGDFYWNALLKAPNPYFQPQPRTDTNHASPLPLV